MKNFYLVIMILVIGVDVFAQAHQSFSYQAVARYNSVNIPANQTMSFRISVLSGNISETAVYSEAHTDLSTNALGLVEPKKGLIWSLTEDSVQVYTKAFDISAGVVYTNPKSTSLRVYPIMKF